MAVRTVRTVAASAARAAILGTRGQDHVGRRQSRWTTELSTDIADSKDSYKQAGHPGSSHLDESDRNANT